MRLKIYRVIFSILLVLFGCIVLFAPSTDTSKDPEVLSKISYRDVEKDQIYYVEDLMIADQYAELDDGDVIYLLVMFEDENGKLIAANMPVNTSSPIRDDVEDYLGDSTQYIGDYHISCYVKAETDYDVEDKLNNMFANAVSRMRTEHGFSATSLGLRFEYICDEDGDPYATAEGANTVKQVVGILVILGGVALFFGTFRKNSKAKAAPQQRQQVQQPQYAPQPQQVRQVTPMGTFTHSVQPQPAATAPNTNDVMAQLNHYKALKDAGYMTEAEFEQKRKELLSL